MKKRIIIQCYPSPIINASRIFRETESIIKLGLADEIIICGLSDNTYVKEEYLDPYRKIIRVRSGNNFRSLLNKGFLGKLYFLVAFFKYNLKIISLVINNKPTYLTVRRAELLPAGVIAKVLSLYKTKLVYAPHELESGREGISFLIRKIFKGLERLLIKQCHSVIVVNESIKEWYKKEFNYSKVNSLINVPTKASHYIEKTNIFRDLFKIPEQETIFIYQGILSEKRGIKFLLNAFEHATKDKHIVFMGYGPMVDDIIESSKIYINIHFQQAVHLSEIVAYTSSADIGVFFLDGLPGLSYQYSLPNKFSEYLIAGLPVVVSSNLIYLSKIIKEQSIGWVIDSTVNNFENFIRVFKKTDKDKLRVNIELYGKRLGWQFEEHKLLEIYN